MLGKQKTVKAVAAGAFTGNNRRQQLMVLMIVILAVSGLRLPSILFRPGGQDELWYSVPGWTVAREGIPRIPYCPSRNEDGAFYRADELLFALPPAHSYLQAVFFRLFPPGYGTARLAGWMVGAVGLLVVYRLLRFLQVEHGLATLAVMVCGLGRAWYFPWQDARPDIVCCTFGLCAIAAACRSRGDLNLRWILATGLFTGLAGLTHPFALIFAFQVTGLLLTGQGTLFQRGRACLIAGLMAVAVFCLWLPLILQAPDLFVKQFSNNVLSRSGPGLVTRLLMPWQYVVFQAGLVLERFGTFQVLLAVGGMTAAVGGAIFHSWKSDSNDTAPDAAVQTEGSGGELWLATCLAVSSIYLHLASVGDHPAKGYLCFPWAMMVVAAAVAVQRFTTNVGISRSWRIGGSILVLLMLLPGAGLRTAWTYATHFRQPSHNVSLFCRTIDSRLPDGARILVSPELVFEFEVLGRSPICASVNPFYLTVEGMAFDYLIASRQNFDEQIPMVLDTEVTETWGDRADEFSCYAEVHVLRPTVGPDRPFARTP